MQAFPPFQMNKEAKAKMEWPRLLAYITGRVDQELLLRNEYLCLPKTSL
jgi:hypothetical protein